MKKLILCTILLIIIPLFSDYVKDAYGGDLGIEIGVEASFIKYEEPGVMEEKGEMYGVSGALVYRGWLPPSPERYNKYMVRLEGRGSYGQVDYDGALSNGTPYTIANIDDYMLEFRALLGYDFHPRDGFTITPYSGYGYRYLNDDPSFDQYGYERESNYFYSPLGIDAMTEFQNGWSIGLRFEYDYFWKGIQQSNLSNIAGFSDVKNIQNDGYGVRGSVRFKKRGEKIDFVIEPFIRYWSIGESEISQSSWNGIAFTGVEPKNNSKEFGLSISAIY